MKKSLLFCLALAACVSPAWAETKTPNIYTDLSFQRISADGRYAVSEVYGNLTIIDLTDGSVAQEFFADDYQIESYSIGHGNCFSADGSILVGSTTGLGNAAYLENGEWHMLNVPNEEMDNLSNGITPDGSRICGSIGLNEMTFENVIMQVPVYWDRNEDGDGYGEYHVLPYPTKDYFGEAPQYVTAISISSDGKTIIGQMVFGNGGITIPVIYKEYGKGDWTYSLPTWNLINPEGLAPVENPGDGPMAPNYEDYMSEEEIEEYYAAINEYYNGNPGETPYPDFKDYMSDENREAYAEAMKVFNEENSIWREKYDLYDEYMTTVIETTPTFLFNNVIISNDDKYIVSTVEMTDPNAEPDPWGWGPTPVLYKPSTVNIETGELKIVDTELSLLVSGVADNGVILAYNGQRSLPMLGYIIKDGDIQEISEYISSVVPAYGEWIKENMTHEVAVDYDPETWDEIFEELTFTGMPVASPDLSIITIWTNTPWDYSISAEGVIFYMSQTTGISTIAADNKNLSVANGELIIPAGFASVEVFNVSGARVKNFSGAEGAVKLNLGNGAYIAKGTRLDGSVSVIKFAK